MFSRNLRYYRLKKGLTKRALASMVQVTPMSISHYESGSRRPSMDIMDALAEALDVEVLDFLANADGHLVFVHGAFPKPVRLTALQQEYICASVEEYMNRFYAIVNILGGNILPEAPACHLMPLSSSPEDDAKALRKHLRLPESGPLGSLVDVLENRGVLVYFLNHEADAFSGIHGLVNGRPYIAVNGNMTTERIRAAIVHELACAFFQWPENASAKDIEKRAAAISGAFLLPAEDAKRELGLLRSAVSKDMAITCRKYGISLPMLVSRANQSRIISDKVAKEFKRNAAPYTKIQPVSVREEPSLFSQLVFRAICEDEISVRKGAELLQTTNAFVQEQCFG